LCPALAALFVPLAAPCAPPTLAAPCAYIFVAEHVAVLEVPSELALPPAFATAPFVVRRVNRP